MAPRGLLNQHNALPVSLACVLYFAVQWRCTRGTSTRSCDNGSLPVAPTSPLPPSSIPSSSRKRLILCKTRELRELDQLVSRDDPEAEEEISSLPGQKRFNFTATFSVSGDSIIVGSVYVG